MDNQQVPTPQVGHASIPVKMWTVPGFSLIEGWGIDQRVYYLHGSDGKFISSCTVPAPFTFESYSEARVSEWLTESDAIDFVAVIGAWYTDTKDAVREEFNDGFTHTVAYVDAVRQRMWIDELDRRYEFYKVLNKSPILGLPFGQAELVNLRVYFNVIQAPNLYDPIVAWVNEVEGWDSVQTQVTTRETSLTSRMPILDPRGMLRDEIFLGAVLADRLYTILYLIAGPSKVSDTANYAEAHGLRTDIIGLSLFAMLFCIAHLHRGRLVNRQLLFGGVSVLMLYSFANHAFRYGPISVIGGLEAFIAGAGIYLVSKWPTHN